MSNLSEYEREKLIEKYRTGIDPTTGYASGSNSVNVNKCACCDCWTSPGKHEICSNCEWQQDDVQEDDPTFDAGGNGVCLNDARENYLRMGVSEVRFLSEIFSLVMSRTSRIIWMKEDNNETLSGAQRLIHNETISELQKSMQIDCFEGIAKIKNEAISGLQMFFSDVNLSDEVACKYKPGELISDEEFVFACRDKIGMQTTHRFKILSNHMTSINSFEVGEKCGLSVADRNSRFKILAIHEYRSKTLILLLHLPYDVDWKSFQSVNTENEDELIKTHIKLFEDECNLELVPEPDVEKWLSRYSFPIGMNTNSEFIDIE